MHSEGAQYVSLLRANTGRDYSSYKHLAPTEPRAPLSNWPVISQRVGATSLPAALMPVGQKLRLALVCQRVIEHLIDYLEGNGGNVGAHARSFDHVDRMTHAGCKHFCFPIVVSVDLNNVLQQQQAILADIIKPAQERTDERSSGFCRQNRLGGREAKRDVDLYSLVRQLVCRFQTFASQRALDHDIGYNRRVVTPLANHPFGVFTGALSRDWAAHNLTDSRDMFFEIDVTFFGD